MPTTDFRSDLREARAVYFANHSFERTPNGAAQFVRLAKATPAHD
jgi:hypothetical protein